ncbi:MAG: PHP domain-containing protein [Planctomycetes bacterium]|nr:PHP domain-containing protein [Planctomycetota bacterium]
MSFDFDYHVHTKLSYCSEGELTVDALRQQARARGLKGFAITDHTAHLYFDGKAAWQYPYITDFTRFSDLLETRRPNFEGYLAMLAQQKAANDGPAILTGTETDVAANGQLVFDTRYRRQLDIFLGGIHWLPCLKNRQTGPVFIQQFLDFTLMLLEHDIDILAHPTRVFRRLKLDVPRDVVDPIVRKARDKGIAIEINSHTQCDPDSHFVKRCLDEGVKLALGTDTHHIREIGDFTHHRALLASLGITESQLDGILFRHNGIPNREPRTVNPEP